jgi:phosphatidylserine/phosphatidylglycerophosphate/cardiolipin synthase-like enzyme
MAAGGGHAVLHAKAAVADEHLALVSSANLTGRGLDGNVELGLLVRGGPVVIQLARHLQALMSAGVFVVVQKI